MAKSRKTKSPLPKRVAGLKVPRELRKGRTGRLLASPLGIAIMSELAVRAGVGAARSQSRPGSSTRRFADHPVDSLKALGTDARDTGADTAGAVRAAFAAAADAFTEALQAHRDEGPDRPKRSRPTAPAGAH